MSVNVQDEFSGVEPGSFREGVELFSRGIVDWAFADLVAIGDGDRHILLIITLLLYMIWKKR